MNIYEKPIFIKDIGLMFATEKSKRKTRYSLYMCQCGNEFKAIKADIDRNFTKSCGCHNRNVLIQRNSKHGMRYHKLYAVLSGMIQRTTNINHKSFSYYGGRGISVCDEWVSNKESFIKWAIINGYQEGLSIDRIDNNGNYEPSNCRFVTHEMQVKNTILIRSNNTSGFCGVSFSHRSNKWVAQIGINGSRKWLGEFNEPLCAAICRENFIKDHQINHAKNFK